MRLDTVLQLFGDRLPGAGDRGETDAAAHAFVALYRLEQRLAFDDQHAGVESLVLILVDREHDIRGLQDAPEAGWRTLRVAQHFGRGDCHFDCETLEPVVYLELAY